MRLSFKKALELGLEVPRVGELPGAKKSKKHVELNLLPAIAALGLPIPEREYPFAAALGRKWRFDYAWPERKVCLEVEGGIWNNGAHVRGKHYESDIEKYNCAELLRWMVLRASTGHITSGIVWDWLREALQ